MPHYMVRLKDHYVVWSTVVDAPIQVFKSLDELREWSLERYGSYLSEVIDESIERLKINGTNSRYHKDAIDTIWFNRAGPKEQPMTIEGIYRYYCLGEELQDQWLVPVGDIEDDYVYDYIIGDWREKDAAGESYG